MQVNDGLAALPPPARQRPIWQFDALLAAAFVVAVLASTWKVGATPQPPDARGVALALASTVPYFFRRRAPLAVLVVSLSAGAALYIDGYNPGPLPLVVAVGVYTVGAYATIRDVVIGTIFTNFAMVVMLVADSPQFAVPEFVTTVPVYIATMLVGWNMQQRRLRADALEREHIVAAERAAAQERLRIAQELHDVIGHSLGVIAVQAGVGMHLIDSDPEEAKRALENISRTSRSSLAEIRRLLGLVRAGDVDAYAPTPGIADLARLADEVAASGLPVELTITPGPHDLPPGVELSAYRIAQEALTNARKHANARQARVQVDIDDAVVRVIVTDDGTARTLNGARPNGHGLIGMRERVAVYGGTLDTGPIDGGGYRVAATLPYEDLG